MSNALLSLPPHTPLTGQLLSPHREGWDQIREVQEVTRLLRISRETNTVMERYIGRTWSISTILSWLSFGLASWYLADDFETRTLAVTLRWFLVSLFLLYIGLRRRKSF